MTDREPASAEAIPDLGIITPTYFGDIDQFGLLRESIRLFAPSIRHLAIVHTEDVPEFHRRFGHEPNLEIAPTARFLPPEAERRRRRPREWKIRRFFRELLTGEQISGWHAQQITKICALSRAPFKTVVYMDSDIFLCRPLQPSFFFADGKARLLRRAPVNAEQMDFDISSHDLMGVPLEEVASLHDYMYHPIAFNRSTGLALVRRLEELHGSRWIERFVQERRPSEYHLMGYAASVLEGLEGYTLVEGRAPEEMHHSIRFEADRDRFQYEVDQCLSEEGRKGFFLIQSRLRLDFHQVQAAFRQVVESALRG